MLPARREDVYPMRSFRSELDRLFESFFGGLLPEATRAEETMAGIEIDETEDGFELCADVPGFKPEEVQVQVTGDMLTIEAEQSEERRGDGEGRSRMLRRFRRSMTIPPTIDAENIKARLENGVLVVDLPRAQSAQPRRIEVQSQQQGGSPRIATTKGAVSGSQRSETPSGKKSEAAA